MSSDATGGLAYGAVGVGIDFFDYSYNVVFCGDGSINCNYVYMVGYEALGDMTLIGESNTPAFYSLSDGGTTFGYVNDEAFIDS